MVGLRRPRIDDENFLTAFYQRKNYLDKLVHTHVVFFSDDLELV